jgi:predicted nucleic acid-binding protein
VPIVIADTGPINYLILIGHIDVLPVLFEKIILPSIVRDELMRPKTPLSVRNWIDAAPVWLDVRAAAPTTDMALAGLDGGEKAVIALAVQVHADLLLMDDRRGVKTARSKGFRVAGTLGIPGMAERRHLLDLTDALNRLKQTSFHYSQEIMDQFLADQGGKA